MKFSTTENNLWVRTRQSWNSDQCFCFLLFWICSFLLLPGCGARDIDDCKLGPKVWLALCYWLLLSMRCRGWDIILLLWCFLRGKRGGDIELQAVDWRAIDILIFNIWERYWSKVAAANIWGCEWSKNVLGMQLWLPFAASPLECSSKVSNFVLQHIVHVFYCGKGTIRYLQRQNSRPWLYFCITHRSGRTNRWDTRNSIARERWLWPKNCGGRAG